MSSGCVVVIALLSLQCVQCRIPMNMLHMFQNITNMEDFFNNFVDPETVHIDEELYNRTMDRYNRTEISSGRHSSDTKSGAELLMNIDKCSPRLSTVCIEQTSDQNSMIIPPCILLEQCGGCCLGDYHECVPTETVPEPIWVAHITYTIPGSTHVSAQRIIPKIVTKHLECTCQCKVQASDCTAQQTYNANECRCNCPPETFTDCPHNQHWDSSTCQCVCDNVERLCQPGHEFNSNRCRCEATELDHVAAAPTTGTCEHYSCPPGWGAIRGRSGCTCVPPGRR